MVKRRKARRNKLKEIFRDGWEEFKGKYQRYEEVDEVVQKMLGCGDVANGYAMNLCPDCHEEHRVAFSCKSTFCLSCARKYGQRWVETVKEMLHPGVGYRHLTLTIPVGLRTLFYQHAPELLAGLMGEVAPAMNAAVGQAKRKAIEVGNIVVLQTAGRAATLRFSSGQAIQSASACVDDGWGTDLEWEVARTGVYPLQTVASEVARTCTENDNRALTR